MLALSEFLRAYAIERSVSAGHVEQISITVRLFGRFLGREATTGDLAAPIINGWLLDAERNRAAETINGRRKNLLILWRAAHDAEIVSDAPGKLRRAKEPDREIEGFSADDARAAGPCRNAPGRHCRVAHRQTRLLGFISALRLGYCLPLGRRAGIRANLDLARRSRVACPAQDRPQNLQAATARDSGRNRAEFRALARPSIDLAAMGPARLLVQGVSPVGQRRWPARHVEVDSPGIGNGCRAGYARPGKRPPRAPDARAGPQKLSDYPVDGGKDDRAAEVVSRPPVFRPVSAGCERGAGERMSTQRFFVQRSCSTANRMYKGVLGCSSAWLERRF